MRRSSLLAAIAASLLAVGCATPAPSDYAQEQPVLDLARYFNGELTAHGLFTDRSGRVARRFVVAMKGSWNGDEGVLEEDFTYSDGKTERRIWRLTKEPGGRYRGTAADVVGTASGQAAGNALQWHYTLRLAVDGKTYDVQFNDWMYLIDERVMINRAVMSKYGIRLGEVTLAFIKK